MQLAQAVRHHLNISEIVDFIAEKMGIDMRLLNTPEEQALMQQDAATDGRTQQGEMPTDETVAGALQ